MKMDEVLGFRLSSFFSIFEEPVSDASINALRLLRSSKDIQQLKNFLLHGGYPEPVLSQDQDFFLDWMDSYFDTYINRDMRYLYPRLDLVKYRRMVAMLSSLSGTVINRSEIARSVEMSEKSVRDYLEIITGTFFWRELPAFITPAIKTTLKLPKGHFRDSGLALFLQNVQAIDQLNQFPRLGNFFEAFIVEELIRGFEAAKIRNLCFHHFRTKAGGEVDLIVSGSFGMVPIEVKYSSHVRKRQITSLTHLMDALQLPVGIVISNCEEPSLLTSNIVEIPAGCL